MCTSLTEKILQELEIEQIRWELEIKKILQELEICNNNKI